MKRVCIFESSFDSEGELIKTLGYDIRKTYFIFPMLRNRCWNYVSMTRGYPPSMALDSKISITRFIRLVTWWVFLKVSDEKKMSSRKWGNTV